MMTNNQSSPVDGKGFTTRRAVGKPTHSLSTRYVDVDKLMQVLYTAFGQEYDLCLYSDHYFYRASRKLRASEVYMASR